MDLIISQDFFPVFGGAHSWLYEVYRRWPTPAILLAQDYSEDVFCAPKQKSFDRIHQGNLKILRENIAIKDINIFDMSCIKKYSEIVQKIIRNNTFDCRRIHCVRSFPEGVAAIILKKILKKIDKVIIYVHGEELLIAQTSKQISLLAKWVYRNADLVIANSKSTETMLKNFCPKVNVIIIHPGVDTIAYKVPLNERNQYRREWGFNKNTTILTTIARMEARKNHKSVLKSIALLSEKEEGLGYVVGGDGEEKDYLLALARRLGIESIVRFTGNISEKDKILTLCSSDIHIMPSIKIGPMVEGFGIVFLEAAAAGIPSIGGNTGGQIEAVLNGETGVVVDGESIDAITKAVRCLERDKDLCVRLGENGKRWEKRMIGPMWHGKLTKLLKIFEHGNQLI